MRIQRRLQLVGPGPAAYYRDACQLLDYNVPLVSTSHLVSHLLREIDSSLRDALKPMMAQPESSESKGGVTRQEPKLNGHQKEILAVLKGLEIDETDPVGRAWLAFSEKDADYSLARLAHRSRLDPPRPFDAAFRDFVEQFEGILDQVLERMEGQYTAYLKVVDSVLGSAEPPAAKIYHFLPDRFPSNLTAYEYLFEKLGDLNDPAWLEPLREEGFFRHPPETLREVSEDGTTVTLGFRRWPQSRYLVRMARAGHDPETILRITEEMTETDNIHVHEDLVRVAIALPASLAAQLAARAGKWSTSRVAGFLPERVGSLVSHLARGGEVDAALDLARSLLAVEADNPPPVIIGGKEFPLGPTPRGHFDDWMYEQITDKLVPDLVSAAGLRALELTCDLLEEAITRSIRPGDAGPPRDYLDTWWPAVESTEENRRAVAGVRGTLISAVRDTAEQLATADPTSLISTILPVLVQRRWRIFRRLELHLMRRFAAATPELVANRLTDPALLALEPLPREYKLLAEEQFASLSPENQATILDVIATGPDMSLAIERMLERTGSRPSDEDIAHDIQVWQWQRLAPIRNALPEEWRQRYDKLASQFGEPDDPDAQITDGPWTGPTSPLTVEALQGMSVDKIVAELNSWNPPGVFPSPTPEGMGRALSEAVETDPVKFAREAGKFEGLDPTYVHALVSGLGQSIKASASIPWEPVLYLCRWTVEQPREIAGRDRTGWDGDPSWGWARGEIARLVADGLVARSHPIPFDLRSAVWSVLEILSQDPEPTPEDEEEYGGPDFDPLDFALNTVRPTAIGAVLRYTVWVRAHLIGLDKKAERWRGFDEVPEARAVLESRLDPRIELSATVRAVYGEWLSSLVQLDASWVQEHLAQLFPLEPELSLLRDTAWEAYVVANRPSRNTFELLRDEYDRAVAGLGDGEPRWSWRSWTSPPRAIAEHLVTLYAWDVIGLDDASGILEDFYRRAPAAVQAHVIAWVGRELQRALILLEPEQLGRLAALWEHRLALAESSGNPTDQHEELAAFGWWFLSRRFDEDWLIKQLRRVLRLIGSVNPNGRVVEQLAVLAEERPQDAVECFALTLGASEDDEWRVVGWLPDARALLMSAIEHGDDATKRAARDVANRLVARGHVDFGDLA